MLENLLQLVTEHAGQAIVQNPAIPNEHNGAAIQNVTNSIVSGLQGQLQGGSAQQLIGMLAGQQGIQGNPIVNAISQNAVGNLMQQFGIQNQQAEQIVSQLLPTVMQQFVQKTNDPADSSFDLNGIVNSLSGGQVPSDIGGILNQFTGGQAQQGGLGNVLGGLGKIFG